MARKIAFLNYKGGVGKTSLIVNLAACLAKAGQRVLLFDFDTQSNASIWLLRLERWNKINNSDVGAVFSIFQPGTAKLKDIVIKDVVEGKNGEKLRVRAAETIGQIGDPRSTQVLVEIVRRKGRLFTTAEPVQVRLAACKALLALDSPPAWEALCELVAAEPWHRDRTVLQQVVNTRRTT